MPSEEPFNISSNVTGNEPLHSYIPKELALLNLQPLFDIELSSKCNISCVFCPREKMEKIGMGLMDSKTMASVAEWLPLGSSVIISGLGEPLLNPRLA